MAPNPYSAPLSSSEVGESNWPTTGHIACLLLGIAALVFATREFIGAEYLRQNLMGPEPASVSASTLLAGPIRGITGTCLGIVLLLTAAKR